MPLIALTGGIASGKSTIAARLAGHGAIVVDADALVREVQRPGSPVLAAIAAEFGASTIRPDGELDRPALGAPVVADSGGGGGAMGGFWLLALGTAALTLRALRPPRRR